MLLVACERCGSEFWKRFVEVYRSRHCFCSRACYFACVDHTKLGRAGAVALNKRLPTAEQRFARSHKGGVIRAQKLSKERLHEIGMLGVAARMARPAEWRSTISKGARATQLVRQRGQLARTSPFYVISPALTQKSDEGAADES